MTGCILYVCVGVSDQAMWDDARWEPGLTREQVSIRYRAEREGGEGRGS